MNRYIFDHNLIIINKFINIATKLLKMIAITAQNSNRHYHYHGHDR